MAEIPVTAQSAITAAISQRLRFPRTPNLEFTFIMLTDGQESVCDENHGAIDATLAVFVITSEARDLLFLLL